MSVKMNDRTDSFKSGKLIQILKTFSKAEILEFDKFIRSPFFNNRSELPFFFKILKKFYPGFDNDKLTKVNIFHLLYPGKTYRDNVMRRVISNLKLLAEKYLSYKEYADKNTEVGLNLLISYNKRGLNTLFQKEIDFLKEKIDTSGGIDSEYFLNKLNLVKIEYDFNAFSGNRDDIIKNVSERGNYLIYFFLSEYFYELNERVTYAQNYNTVFKNDLLSVFKDSFNTYDLFDKIKTNKDTNTKLLLAYYYSHESFINYNSELSQDHFRNFLAEHSDNFSKWSQAYFFHMLISTYVSAKKEEIKNYNNKLFDAYKELINKDLIVDIETGYIQEEKILNIFITATNLGEYDWIEVFIEENINKLHPDLRLNWYNFYKAAIAYHKNNLKSALNYVLKVNFDKAILNIKVKVLQTQIYYDLEYFEQLFSFIDSFRHYLDNNKSVSDNIKYNTKLYLNNLFILSNNFYNHDFDSLNTAKKYIESSKIYNKIWLLKKINELESLQKNNKKRL